MNGWTICLFLSLIASSLCQVCNYNDCVDCVSGGCGWCDDNEVCLPLSASSTCTNSSQCFKTSTAYGAKCSKVSCSSLTNCNSCVYNGCGWCDTTNTCNPIHNDGTEPCGFNCPNNTQCWKNSIAYGAKCPTASCSINTNCYSCVAAGCGWCDITSQCLPTSNDGSEPCVGNCTNQCYKNSIAYGAKCASASCSSYLDCYDCVNNGCGWCDITGKCLPTFNDATEPCIENCTDQCYKVSTAYGAKCPSTNCSIYLDCNACVSEGCGWCDTTGMCLPTYNNGLQPCVGNCSDQCYKRSTAYNAKCPSRSCSNYTNCVSCASGGCGWCDSTQQCLPVYNNASGPCQSSCPDNDQCWKTSTAYNAPCASQLCSTYSDCYDCVSSGCGWCSFTQSCLPRSNDNTESCTIPCSNSSSCFKTSTSSYSMCNSYSCSSYSNCTTCMDQDDCTWCASTGTCVEQGYNDALCSNCDDPVTPGNCPDCASYGCSNNATCMQSGFCNCSADYYGYYCQQYCNAAITCNGNGACSVSGNCECNEYYYGNNCSQYCNANVTCQGRGWCNAIGDCVCNDPYYGSTCQIYCDPAVNCSANGYCSAQGCQCYYGYYGNNCNTYCDNFATCNGNGNCDTNGKCVCTTGSGDHCTVSSGPSGGTIAGIIVGALIAVCCVGCCAYIFFRKKSRKPYDYSPILQNSNSAHTNGVVTRLHGNHPEFTRVKQLFYDKWTKGDPEKIKIISILSVSNNDTKSRYRSYQNRMDLSHSSNVQQVFHGTKLSVLCRLQSHGSLCGHSDCAVCCISNDGFKLSKSGTNISFARFGRGIYFAPNSSKANDYNEATVRGMLVCDVLAGNEYHSEDNMQTLTAPPTGYHSVRGIVGTKLNYPELVVYDEDAINVTNIVLYSVSP